MAELSPTIPIGEWLPDRADFENEGCLVAQNVIPDGEDYKPFPSFEAQTSALPTKGYQGYSHIASNGTVTNFLATQGKLYIANNGSLTDVSKVGGYNTPIDGYWFFTQFGNRVVATNYVDKIQTYVVGTDSAFHDLITSGPDVKCRNFSIINNFLVCGDIIDPDGTTSNRIRWSPINDPSGNWTASQSTQADYQNCEDGNPGPCMGIIGGQNYGVVLFKNAIYRMEYVGPPNIFTFTLMEQGRGPVNPAAIAWNGSEVFYRAENGFWQFNGVASLPIGHRKVDKSFRTDADPTYLYNIRGTADPINKNILFAYTSTEATNGRNDKMFLYNWLDKRFTEIIQPCDVIFAGFSSGYTLEDIGAEYPNIELVPYSFDSPFWSGGNSLLAGVVDGQLGYFQGESMTGYLESPEVRLNNDGLSYIHSILPVYEGGECTVRLGHRRSPNDTISYTPYLPQSADTGEVNLDNESRYHRAGVELTGDWRHFQGIRYRAEAGSPL